MSSNDWKSKVKETCILKGYGWSSSVVSTVCSEQEYYDDLVKAYRNWMRLYPYHLEDYICRVLRITPYKYYTDLMFNVIKEEKSYDKIPNFTAADALRVLGIGRNEYIHIMNQCKGKKLLWKVNKHVAKEYLPSQPLDVKLEPWWYVGVVNVAEQEYRELNPDELANMKTACLPGNILVRDLDEKVLKSLYKKGLVFLKIPIKEEDRFLIPPLEGFVSNKTSDAGDSTVDPIESLLYAVFIANSERMHVSDLATILNVDIKEVKNALAIAVRLGFATRVSGDDEVLGWELAAAGGGATGLQELIDASALGGGARPAVAVVVDAEATSYLMMGALSPGLKRHSVTLFEAGRVTGEDVISELISELWVSYAAGQNFEGDMLRLTNYAAALATCLESVRDSSEGRPLELLRKESLAGLTPLAACKVLSHAYCAVVPITPMPHPPLPLAPDRPGPCHYGPSVDSASPWMHLTLYTLARCGPKTLVFVCGQRVWRLPPELETCTHALLWPWDGHVRVGAAATAGDGSPQLVEMSFLLYTLNDMLVKTAVMVQPLTFDLEADDTLGPAPCPLAVVDVPLPLNTSLSSDPAAPAVMLVGVEQGCGEERSVWVGSPLVAALRALGLPHAVGFVRLMSLKGKAGANVFEPGAADEWLPLSVQLGIPLYCLHLTRLVCDRAKEAGFLTAEGRAAQHEGQVQLDSHLRRLVQQYATNSACFHYDASNDHFSPLADLPAANLLFDGCAIQQVDLGGYLQGLGLPSRR